MHHRLRAVALVVVLQLAVVGIASVQADETADRLRALIDKHKASIVLVKAVIKTEMMRGGQSQDRENRGSMLGVVVDNEGLVMIQGRQFVNDNPNVKRTPIDLKIVFEGEEKEHNAFLAGLDSKLGLAFIKIEALGDHKVTPVDFSGAVDPVIGQQVASVGRLPKNFDFVPFFETARVSAEVTKPRRAWVIEGGLSTFGLPVFAIDGQIIGALSSVQGPEDEDGGGGGIFGRASLRVILPGGAVKATIEQARKQAVEVAAERAKQAAEGETKSGTEAPKDNGGAEAPPKDDGGGK